MKTRIEELDLHEFSIFQDQDQLSFLLRNSFRPEIRIGTLRVANAVAEFVRCERPHAR